MSHTPPLLWLDPDDEVTPFPPVDHALAEPNGLLAVGGALSPRRLEMAYAHGIFPWFSEGQPVLWWSPDPRAVIVPGRLRVTRSLRKRLRNGGFFVTLDTAFERVMRACARPRRGQPGTWITAEMLRAYLRLHELGLAHSVEVWQHGHLRGGLYGVAIGRVFFGESMFSSVPDASKVALVWLVGQLWRWRYRLVDCQVASEHLSSLGAVLMGRREFSEVLQQATVEQGRAPPWRFDPDFTPLAAIQGDSI